MHAPPATNSATLRCEQVYRAAQAHGVTLGGKNPPPEDRFASHPGGIIKAEAAIVRDIFERTAAGDPMWGITKDSNARSVRATSGRIFEVPVYSNFSVPQTG
jgi:hypothetical protein